jgi:anti-sigma factor (TIGR02949 family)
MTIEQKKIDCEEAIRKMLEYLDNELEHQDHESLEEHLHSCRSCFSRMEFEKRLKEMVKTVTREKVPEDLQERIRKITKSFQEK